MSAPVLITVVALGAGWVAISRHRGKAPATNPGATTDAQAVKDGVDAVSGAGAAVGAEGGNPVVNTDLGVVIDPVRTDGADPSTTPGAGTSPASAMSDGQPQSPDVTPTPDVTPVGVTQVYGGAFGSQKGVTTRQQSKALGEFGPALGMVW